MKQKTKEIQIQNIPLQEQNKEYQLILWGYLSGAGTDDRKSDLFCGELGTEDRYGDPDRGDGRDRSAGKCAGTTVREKNFYKGDTLRDSVAAPADVTGFHGYLTGFLSWINAIITGWNLSQEGRCSPF